MCAGMAAGIAALVKEIDPGILVIGVEPTGANKMAISLKTGKRVSLDNVRLYKHPAHELHLRMC